MRFINLNRILAVLFALAVSSGWQWSQQVLPAPEQPREQPITVEQQTPKLEFETLTHDLGKSIQGQNLKCVFRFKNTGTGTLEILKVKGG